MTNRDLLVAILGESEFQAATIDTGYLERHPPRQLIGDRSSVALRVHLVAAAVVEQQRRRDQARVLATLPSGWRNNPSGPQRATFLTYGDQTAELGYCVGRGTIEAQVDGATRARSGCTASAPRAPISRSMECVASSRSPGSVTPPTSTARSATVR